MLTFLLAGVIASAVIPTMIADMAFLPKHLIPAVIEEDIDDIESGVENEQLWPGC